MTLDDLIAELETARAWRGGDAAISGRAELAFRGAGLIGGGAAMPALPDPPDVAMLPTSAEFADWLVPRVKTVLRARKPLASIVVMPILAVVIRIVLQIVWMEVAKRFGGSAAAAPGGGGLLPWSDADGDIPDDVKRAARMED